MYDQYYRVQVAGMDLDPEELHYPAGADDIKIVPCVVGAGGGWGKVIAGAALVGLAFATGGASLTYANYVMLNPAVTGLAFTGIWAKAAVYLGAALVLGGVSDLLTPTPKTPEFEEDVQNSFYFSGIVNSARPGTPVPVCYGEVLTGSTTISSSVDVNQVEV
jgi:predicted phage tail protein